MTAWVLVGLGFGLAILVLILGPVRYARRVRSPLRTLTAWVEDPGRDAIHVPAEGSRDVRLLAGAIDRMVRDLGARIDAIDEERATRDAILAALDEGAVVFDGSGEVLYRNSRAAELLGGLVPEARRLAPLELQRLVLEAEPDRVRRAVIGTARNRTLEVAAAPLPGSRLTLLVLRDVTHERRVDAIRREFVSNASHELKTPAASIRALAETIASTLPGDPEDTTRFVAQLEQEAIRLSRIVSDLLDLSRLESEEGERAPVRLNEIVADEVHRFVDRAQQAQLSLAVADVAPAEVLGSPADLALLVRNLVENAIQYSQPGGTVDVTLVAQGRVAILTVRDTGVGIPTRDRTRIFERFYRVDRARSRETGGTGLGLSIVKHVAENHGGTVSVESELGKGSTFVVRIPLARDPERTSLQGQTLPSVS